MSRPAPTEPRICISCHRPLPLSAYYSAGHGNGRRRTCKRCLLDDAKRVRRRGGAPVRHSRFNAHGDIWCNRCEHYRDVTDFKRHPSRPGTYWSYCKPCTREIDRERYARRTSTLEGALADLEKRYQRKERQRQREFGARRRFLVESISLLRRRGLSKAEIARLTDTTFGNLLRWERGECERPTKAVCDRFVVVVRETAHLPIGEPVRGHGRRPHPAMGELLARCLPQVEAIPVRNAWKNGRRA